MILFFDTESTGLPKNYKAPVTDLQNWPRLVQIGWVCYLNNGTLLEQQEHIIKPVKFKIPAEASAIHGVTQAVAMKEGEDLKKVITAFAWRVYFADTLVGHNIDFDDHILGAEFLRTKVSHAMDRRPKVCTMKASTLYCNIPGNYGPKWPKLTELYSKLFGKELAQTHTALDDIEATAACYFELIQLGILPGSKESLK